MHNVTDTNGRPVEAGRPYQVVPLDRRNSVRPGRPGRVVAVRNGRVDVQYVHASIVVTLDAGRFDFVAL